MVQQENSKNGFRPYSIWRNGLKTEYDFDGAGNAISKDEEGVGETTYRYNGANQLVEVNAPGAPSQKYEYYPPQWLYHHK